MSSITKHDSKEKWKRNDCIQSYEKERRMMNITGIDTCTVLVQGVVIKPRPLIDRAPRNDESSLLHIQCIIMQVTQTLYTLYIYNYIYIYIYIYIHVYIYINIHRTRGKAIIGMALWTLKREF